MKQIAIIVTAVVVGAMMMRGVIIGIYERAEISRIQNDIAVKQAAWEREKECLNAQGIE